MRTDIHTDGQTEREAGGKKQSDKHTDRQRDRRGQRDRQTDSRSQKSSVAVVASSKVVPAFRFDSRAHPLPSVQGVCHTPCLREAKRIPKALIRPDLGPFMVLPSVARYRRVRAQTTRLTNTFSLQAIKLLHQANLNV